MPMKSVYLQLADTIIKPSASDTLDECVRERLYCEIKIDIQGVFFFNYCLLNDLQRNAY